MPPWYDDLKGLEEKTTTLAGLNEIYRARREAGRNERLHEWCILGRWILDTCGNFSKITEGAPAAAFPRVPAVMPVADVYEYYVRTTSSTLSSPPPAHVRCPGCDRRNTSRWTCAEPGTFTAEDAHDAVKVNRDESENFDRFAGQTVAWVNNFFSKNSPYEVRLVVGLTNPAWVDLSPHPRIADWVVNKDGWREMGAATQDEPILLGTTVTLVVFEWWHSGCQRKKHLEEEKMQFREVLIRVFPAPGGADPRVWFDGVMKPIKNEYWESKDAFPWYLVETSIGMLKIGWRKRVIVLDWSQARLLREPDFSKEDVTKWATGIHAWGYGKLAEYLGELKRCAS